MGVQSFCDISDQVVKSFTLSHLRPFRWKETGVSSKSGLYPEIHWRYWGCLAIWGCLTGASSPARATYPTLTNQNPASEIQNNDVVVVSSSFRMWVSLRCNTEYVSDTQRGRFESFWECAWVSPFYCDEWIQIPLSATIVLEPSRLKITETGIGDPDTAN